MILITGATGLLGSHLLYSLLSMGEKIRATKRKTSDLEEVKRVFSFYTDKADELFNQVEWIEADLLDPESLLPLFKDIDQVYHMAARVSFDPRDRKLIINQNREVAANMVNASLEAGNIRFLHVSSTSALGDSKNGEAVDEKAIWTPDNKNSAYSISKFLSEMEVWRAMEEGLEAVIVNPSIIMGPGFSTRGSGAMFSNIKKGMRYYTSGVTGYVGVEDVVKCMISLMNSDIRNERFIISSQNLSYQNVFQQIASEMGLSPRWKEASPLMAGIAWRADAFRSFFGTQRVITRETVNSGFHKVYFSNEKIKQATGIQFEDINKVIRKIVASI